MIVHSPRNFCFVNFKFHNLNLALILDERSKFGNFENSSRISSSIILSCISLKCTLNLMERILIPIQPRNIYHTYLDTSGLVQPDLVHRSYTAQTHFKLFHIVLLNLSFSTYMLTYQLTKSILARIRNTSSIGNI